MGLRPRLHGSSHEPLIVDTRRTIVQLLAAGPMSVGAVSSDDVFGPTRRPTAPPRRPPRQASAPSRRRVRLDSQTSAGTRTAGRHSAGSNEATISQAIEDEYRVAVRPVRHRVHSARESKSQPVEALRILCGQRCSRSDHERGDHTDQNANETILQGHAPFVDTAHERPRTAGQVLVEADRVERGLPPRA
jgi:hypothetical protein